MGVDFKLRKCAILHFTCNSRELVPPEYFLDGGPLPICRTHSDLGLLVDDKLKFHGHVSSVAHKKYGLCQSFLKSTVCRTPEFLPETKHDVFAYNTCQIIDESMCRVYGTPVTKKI